MKKEKKNKRQITVRISTEILNLVEKEAKKQQVTKTYVHRQAIQEYFSHRKKLNFPLDEIERHTISIRISEKEAEKVQVEIFRKQISRTCFFEAILKDYFAKLEK